MINYKETALYTTNHIHSLNEKIGFIVNGKEIKTTPKPSKSTMSEYAVAELIANNYPMNPLQDYSTEEEFNVYKMTLPLTTDMMFVYYAAQIETIHPLYSKEWEDLMQHTYKWVLDKYQYNDVDVVVCDVVSNEDGSIVKIYPHDSDEHFSVKYDNYSKTTKKFAFEKLLIDTRTKQQAPGSVAKSTSKQIFMVSDLFTNCYGTEDIQRIMEADYPVRETKLLGAEETKKNGNRKFNSTSMEIFQMSTIRPYLIEEYVLPKWYTQKYYKGPFSK